MKLTIFIIFLFVATLGYGEYQPAVGDIYFQSLEKNAVVNAIEGATESPYSHCGILIKKEGVWYIREAIGPVKDTPQKQWILQARDDHLDIFRLKKEFRKHIPEMLVESEKYMGKPYDIRYRMDDENIYCSELIFKSYRDATGEDLGELVRFGDLKWLLHTPVILAIEGRVPVSRIMITPRHLSEATQLEFVFSSKEESKEAKAKAK